MYDVSAKLLNGVKSIFINNIVCERVKEVERKLFRIESAERQR